MQEAVGAAIRARRDARGWTQEQLGSRAELDKGTISRIERGANASVDTLLTIARALGAELVITIESPESRMVIRDDLRAVSSPVTPSDQTGAVLGGVPTPAQEATAMPADEMRKGRNFLHAFIEAYIEEEEALVLGKDVQMLVDRWRRQRSAHRESNTGGGLH